MSPYYYLERRTPTKPSQKVSLGTFTGNTFYPTMAYDVFEILVKEAQFKIQDENGNAITIDSFKDTINDTFSTNPPLITLAD
ncbi:MAG: hypothetical protein ACXADY_22155 [Candidatus Hodarchaeales archaeon]|jgi:hypothetical protein